MSAVVGAIVLLLGVRARVGGRATEAAVGADRADGIAASGSLVSDA